MKYRKINKIIARISGHFWLPCPLCGQMTGGHEWKSVDGHTDDVPDEAHLVGDMSHISHGICQDCTRKGKGCLAYIRTGDFSMACNSCRIAEAKRITEEKRK